MSRRPVVGICAALEQAQWTAWDTLANVSPRTYSAKVAESGALPVLLPPHDESTEEVDQVLDLLDALIVAGGADLDPASYGEEREPETIGSKPERDRFEIALTNAALARELPLLGICRGMEILNIARGGTLIQELPTAKQHLALAGNFTIHEVKLEPGSLAARATGGESCEVHSHHHQGIGELGEGLMPTGHSVPDEVIEAIELPDHPFALGILWHTEEEERQTVIPSLIETTRVEVSAS